MQANKSAAQPPTIPLQLDDQHIFDIPQVRALLIVLYTIIFIFCFFGNLAVVLVVTFHSRMRNMTKFFLGNLAFANLCVGIFCIYQSLTTFIYESWFYGDLMCRMYHFTQSLCHTASILILIAIAIERYWVLLHPFRSRQLMTLRRLAIIITVLWILSAAIASPRLYYFGTIKIPIRNLKSDTICVPKRTLYDSATADTIYFILLYVLPLTIITILYTRIAQNLRQSAILRTVVRNMGESSDASRSVYSHNNEDRGRIPIPTTRGRRLPFLKGSSSSSVTPPLEHNSSAELRRRTSKKRILSWRLPGFRSVTKHRDSATVISTSAATSLRRGSGHLEFKTETLRRISRQSWPRRKRPLLTRSASEPILTNLHENTHGNSTNKGQQKTKKPRMSLSKASLTSARTSTHSCRSDAARVQVTRRLYAVRVLIAIVMSFAVLNLPFHIRKLCLNYLKSYNADSDVNHLLTPFTFLLMYANCAISPILYAFLNKSFRESFCDLMCWKRRGRSRLLKPRVTAEV